MLANKTKRWAQNQAFNHELQSKPLHVAPGLHLARLLPLRRIRPLLRPGLRLLPLRRVRLLLRRGLRLTVEVNASLHFPQDAIDFAITVEVDGVP